MTVFSNSLRLRNSQFNFRSINLPKWRVAQARVRAGTGRGRLLLLGDSTTMGAGAGSGGTTNTNGAYAKNWPKNLAAILNPTIPTSFNSLWTHLSTSGVVAYGTLDTRVTLGANWSSGTVGLFSYTTGAANNLSFTPAGQIDTVVVYMVHNSGTGTATYNVDGGTSLGTITSAGASAVVTYTATVTKGAHTINIVPNNDGNFFVQGIIAYDSTTAAIDVICDGQYGSQTSSWTSTSSPWNFGNHFTVLQPDLTVICLTINDSNASVAVATYQANMQTLITNAKAVGDVIIMSGPPSNTTQATDGTLDSYITALQTLSLSNSVPFLDLKARWTSYAVTNALMPYFDTLHPGTVGYQDEALSVFEAIAWP